MDNILSVKDLTKNYGDNVVVNNVNFEIKKGSICGLLGPNGAGKTTIMKIIMNQIKCDKGNISYGDNLKIKYLQDVPEFYDFYTVEEYLEFILDITKYSCSKYEKIEETLNLFDLKKYRNLKVKKLSRGLKQKLGIASVIIYNPDILILDEPVSALDPIGRLEIFDILLSLKGKTTIIFSSHILTDVEKICDQFILINNGKIILNEESKNMFLDRNNIVIEFKNREDLMIIKENIKYESNFNENIENCLEVYCEDMDILQKDIFKMLVKNNIAINSISIKKNSLEEIFFKGVRANG